MTLPKLLAILAVVLFGIIGIAALFKGKPEDSAPKESLAVQVPYEVELDTEIQVIEPSSLANTVPEPKEEPVQEIAVVAPVKTAKVPTPKASNIELPDADRIDELFNKQDPRLPIVETITYKSHVSWQKGRPAWLSDYASHYNTSRHFIARSLNGKPDYLKQELKEGDRFNVLRNDKNLQFYLLVDTSRCKMWFYYVDADEKQKVLLKTYKVGLGRLASEKASGLLTPIGKYTLGQKITTYKPKVMGPYQGKSIEMITVFGTRWIPFESEIGICTEPAKGYGIHGTPWKMGVDGKLADDTNSIGKYESDGCIRLSSSDIEELFAIIITKPTTIEIVRDFSEAAK